MTEDESTPRPRHRRDVRGPAVDRGRHPEVARGVSRRRPRRRSAPTARTRVAPMTPDEVRRGWSPRRSTADAVGAAVPGRDEGPRHRRRRVHRPLGRRRAARARSHGPADRQPRRRRRRRTSTSSPGSPGLLPVRAGRRPRRRRVPALDRRRSTRSPTSRPRSPSRTRSTTRRRRSRTTSSARSTSSRAPARPGRRVLFMSTCMVYDRATSPAGIAEDHPTKPASPYAASKLAGEALTLSYSPRLRPADDRRPAVQHLRAVPALGRRGRGRRDLHPALAARRAAADLRRRDPDARPAVRRRTAPGSSCDALALRRARRAGSSTPGPARTSASTTWPRAIEPDPPRIVHVEHIHPQSEIAVLRCDPRAAARAPRLASGGPARRGPARASEPGWPSGWRRASPVRLMGTGDRARLAIDGGEPGPHDAPAVRPPGRSTSDDIAAVTAALRSDWLTTGPRVPAFEAALAAFDGRPARGRVQLRDRGAPRRGGRGRARAGRRGDHDADDVRGDRQRRPLRRAPTPRFADVDPGHAPDRPGRGRGGHHAADAGDPARSTTPGQPADYDALRAIADARAGRAADDHRRRVALARRDARRPAGRDARRPDRPEPPPGEDPDDRRGRRGPDRSRRPRRARSAGSATTGSRPSSRRAATGPTRWSSSATTTG